MVRSTPALGEEGSRLWGRHEPPDTPVGQREDLDAARVFGKSRGCQRSHRQPTVACSLFALAAAPVGSPVPALLSTPSSPLPYRLPAGPEASLLGEGQAQVAGAESQGPVPKPAPPAALRASVNPAISSPGSALHQGNKKRLKELSSCELPPSGVRDPTAAPPPYILLSRSQL